MGALTKEDDLISLIPINQLSMIEAERHFEKTVSAEDVFNLGLRFFRYKKYDISLIFFKEVLDKDPKNAQAYGNLGSLFFQMGDEEKAVKFWKHAIALDPKSEKPYLNLGCFYYGKGMVDEAISCWLVLYGISPFDPNVLSFLGVAYDNRNNVFLANYYYKKYLDISRANPTPLFARISKRMNKILMSSKHNFRIGVKMQEKKEYRKAMKAYALALKSYPNHIKANLNMGSICYMSDMFEDAISYWQRAFILGQNNRKIAANIAIAYDRTEKYSYAYAFYHRYLALEPNKESFECISVKKQLEEIDKKIQDREQYYKEHYAKADDFFRNRDYFNAFMEYENAYLLKPENEELCKKVNALKANIYPEKMMSVHYLEQAKKYITRGKMNFAVDVLKKVAFYDPMSEEGIQAKEWLEQCAEQYKEKKAMKDAGL